MSETMTARPSETLQNVKYARPDYDIGRMDPHWADSQMVRVIGSNKTVLEIGCASGHFGKYLKTNSACRVWAVEMDPKLAELARPHYEAVCVGSVESQETLRPIEGKKFDVILCSNVLEHLTRPHEVLKVLKNFLAPNGYFVVALPNVAHWSVRLKLLFGNFDYSDAGGIMDRDHFRFFTLKTSKELFLSAGMKVESWSFDWDNGIPKLNGLLLRVPVVGPWILKGLYTLRPTLFGYQFIFKTVPESR